MVRTRALARQVHEHLFATAGHVSRALADHLPGLGVDACVVASLLPEEPGLTGRIRYGFAPSKQHPDSETLPLSQLVDHPLIENSRTLFLLPLTLGAEPLGVAAFSVTTLLAKADLLEDLRELLSTVLKVMQARHA
jgi:hypothetical protein